MGFVQMIYIFITLYLRNDLTTKLGVRKYPLFRFKGQSTFEFIKSKKSIDGYHPKLIEDLIGLNLQYHREK